MKTKITFNLKNALKLVLKTIIKFIFKININGIENIDKNNKGGFIIANHVSLLDSLIIAAFFPHTVRFVMHKKVYNVWYLSWFFKSLKMIPVGDNNNKTDLFLFEERCKEAIKKGEYVCIFPEGQITRNGQIGAFKKGIEHLIKSIGTRVIPIHLDNFIGTPLSFKIGTSETYSFSFTNWRINVFINFGEPIEDKLSSFQLRQKVKELEVENFALRCKNKLNTSLDSTYEMLEESLQSILSTNEFKITINRLKLIYQRIVNRFELLIIETPNYDVKDISGKTYTIIGSKINTLGKPILGVAIKSVNDFGKDLEANQYGRLYIKSAMLNVNHWVETNFYGSIDEDGFVKIGL
jgi:1-acyl-sn-glycerol-3-phosphate acyltransferase